MSSCIFRHFEKGEFVGLQPTVTASRVALAPRAKRNDDSKNSVMNHAIITL